MKVRAKHNINLSGTYYSGGEVFEISTTDAEALGDMIEIAETPVQVEPEKVEAPKRRGRQKKSEE